MLASECSAARCIQVAWKRRYAKLHAAAIAIQCRVRGISGRRKVACQRQRQTPEDKAAQEITQEINNLIELAREKKEENDMAEAADLSGRAIAVEHPGAAAAALPLSISGRLGGAPIDSAELQTSDVSGTTWWEFLGHADYIQVCQTCTKSLDIVCENTPFVSKPAFMSTISHFVQGSPVLVFSWEGDVLCMDNIIDHFSGFGKCTPEDWSELHGLNVVQVRFESADDAASVCQRSLHSVANDRGRKIIVTAEQVMSNT